MKSLKYSLFILLFLLFIPFTVFADEQEHLSYSPNGTDTFEYYSEDSNVPVIYNEYKSGSTTYKEIKTQDDSYGLFTFYYQNSNVVSNYGNKINLNDLPFTIYSGFPLSKIVFTPLRSLNVGESYNINDFLGYNYISFDSKEFGRKESTYLIDVVKKLIGSTDDIVHVNADVIYYFDNSESKNNNRYFLQYRRSSTNYSNLVTFNRYTGAFCDYNDSNNCIYPNIVSGEPFNIDINYSHNTSVFNFSINDLTLTINKSISIKDYPYFNFYTQSDSYVIDGVANYEPALTFRNYSISFEDGKFVNFYPTFIRTGDSEYKSILNFESSSGVDAYSYNSLYSSGYYDYSVYVSNTTYFDKFTLFYNKPISGSSGGGSGDIGITSDNFYKRIYPPQNVTPIADWVTRIRSTYERLGKEHYALYMTRYNKELDSLVGYYILFDPKDASSHGKITYVLNSDNTLSVTLSDDMYTNFSLTTIFDHDLFANFTPVENGAVGDDLLNYKNWNTYNTIYLDPNEIGFWSALFGSSNLINFGSNVFTNKKYTYSDLEIAKTITFSPIVTNTKDIYENPLVFYTSTSETDKYLDYYVVLNLSDGINSTVKDIYNSSWYKDNYTGEPVLSYYSVMPYLNISFSFGGKDNETTIITSPSTDFDYSDTSYGKYGDEIIAEIKSEDEMKSLSPLQILSENLATLTDLLLGITDDVSSIFYQINDNSSYYYTYLESMSDTGRTYGARGSFISNELITTTKFMSEELQWIYENTPLNVPINIGLCTSLIMAVIF